jgi:hypothetical protein
MQAANAPDRDQLNHQADDGGPHGDDTDLWLDLGGSD